MFSALTSGGTRHHTDVRVITYEMTPINRTKPTKADTMLDRLAHSAMSIWSATSPQPHEQSGPA